MPKKNKDNGEQTEEKEGVGGVVTTLFALLIIFIWLAIFVLLIKFDVGGFGSGVLRPILRDVPIINMILPEVSDEQLSDEYNYPYRNLSEAMRRIEELEAQIAQMTDEGASSADYVAELEAEVARLREFEENQLEFEKRVFEFDQNVVYAEQAPDIEEYKKYYEEINPENAEEIYRQVIQQVQLNTRLKDQAAMFKAMEPADAADILGGMTGDLDLVARILLNMKTKEAGAILAEMDPDMAAKITKKISIMNLY